MRICAFDLPGELRHANEQGSDEFLLLIMFRNMILPKLEIYCEFSIFEVAGENNFVLR